MTGLRSILRQSSFNVYANRKHPKTSCRINKSKFIFQTLPLPIQRLRRAFWLHSGDLMVEDRRLFNWMFAIQVKRGSTSCDYFTQGHLVLPCVCRCEIDDGFSSSHTVQVVQLGENLKARALPENLFVPSPPFNVRSKSLG